MLLWNRNNKGKEKNTDSPAAKARKRLEESGRGKFVKRGTKTQIASEPVVTLPVEESNDLTLDEACKTAAELYCNDDFSGALPYAEAALSSGEPNLDYMTYIAGRCYARKREFDKALPLLRQYAMAHMGDTDQDSTRRTISLTRVLTNSSDQEIRREALIILLSHITCNDYDGLGQRYADFLKKEPNNSDPLRSLDYLHKEMREMHPEF
jgi:hypothetical protein